MTPLADQHPAPAASEPSRTNWAGNYTYHAAHLAEPASQEALERMLPALQQAKAIGTRHSFNHIADTEGTQLALTHLKSLALDAVKRTVIVGAGTTYGELAPWLDGQGFALANLASLPHISVAGACATGTHGSGVGNRCLSSAVVAMEFLDADGRPFRLTREQDGDAFTLAVVHLGALGVVTALTLEVVPSFQVAQVIYQDLSFDVLKKNLRDVFGAGYSVSLFTDWQGHRATQVWIKRKLKAGVDPAFPDQFHGASRQTTKLHPLPNMPAASCTEQLGNPGPWYERLPHFRLDYTPSAGAEIQTEYFVSLDQAYEAITAIEALSDRITPHLLVSELRAIAADDLPMSMCSGRDSLALHFTWKREVDAVCSVLPVIEAALVPFGARPHWAKLFTMAPATVKAQYPQLGDFLNLARKFDPHGRLRNAYLAELLET